CHPEVAALYEPGTLDLDQDLHVRGAPLLKRFGGLRRLVRWLPSSRLVAPSSLLGAPQSSQRAAPATSLTASGALCAGLPRRPFVAPRSSRRAAPATSLVPTRARLRATSLPRMPRARPANLPGSSAAGGEAGGGGVGPVQAVVHGDDRLDRGHERRHHGGVELRARARLQLV